MKDFYALADEPRKVLREMFPHGYARVVDNGNSVTIKITHYQPVPVVITYLAVNNNGTATIKSK